MMKKLTDREQLFVREYLIDKNKTRATIAAGYSRANATHQGSLLLSYPHIQAEIDAQLAPRKANLEITAERVLTEIARLAFYDVRLLYNADGTVKDITSLDDDTAAVIQGVEVSTDKDGNPTTQKVRIADKAQALEKLVKYLGLYQRDNEQKVDPLTALLQGIAARSSNGIGVTKDNES